MLIIARRMSEPIVEWVGSSCGKHGAYTFYKGFQLTTNGETRKYLLGEFYFIRNSKDRPICIAEFQLLWHDANTDNKLASARLYFRPESIPGGRQSCHGKDELLYTDEKVVIQCKDMMNLEYDGTGWSYGIKAISELYLQEVPTTGSHHSEDKKKFRLLRRVSKSKTKKMIPKERSKMIVLSFPAYCRFKSLMKKLSSGLVLTKMAIKAFGGIIQCNDCTWVSFSRESFHHPGLTKFDMFSHNKAPVLKGRPRKKKPSKSTASKDEIKAKNSEVVNEQPSNEADSSDDNQTDTSETSSIGEQELPCPPKLVKEEPAIQPEASKGVIRSVKQASEYVGKPSVIPPIPKLVKIEPPETNATPYRQFQHYTEPDVSLMNNKQTSSYLMDKNIPLKSSFSSSVTSTSHCRDVGRSRDNGARVTYTTQSCKVEQVGYTCPTYVPTGIHANTSLVPRATTITSNYNMQPRMSTIVSTPLATKGEVTKNVRTCELSRPGDEAGAEQPLKRKRGRPPGKSNKVLKLSEIKIAPKKETSSVEVNGVDDQIQINMEVETSERMFSEVGILLENEEDSPEPQNAEERKFMKNLKIFMRKQGSPIEKVPALGFRKINLFKMYEVTQALGGYDQVTSKRLWRRVYNEVGGAPSITSAATNTRKHYEKLLLPFERYLSGEDYLLDIKHLESPSPTPDGHVSPQRDQNGNVVSQYNSVVLSTNQQDKPTVSHVTPMTSQTKPKMPSHVQPSSLQENSFKPDVSLVSKQKELFKSAVSRETSLGQQNKKSYPVVTRVVSSSQQGRQSKPVVSNITSISSQNKQNISTVMPMSPSDRAFHPAVAQTIEQTHYAKPTVSYQNQQDRRSVVSRSNTQYQCNKATTQTTDANSAVEFVTTGNRGSPIMLYSSNVNKLCGRYPTNIPLDHHSIRRDTRAGVITGTGTSQCAVNTKQEPVRNEKKSYITEFSDDYTGMYVAKNKVKNEPRTSMPEFENRSKYMPCYDHVNNFRRNLDFHSSEHISEESRDIRKHARGNGDEIRLTNVVPSKISRAHSPLPRDEGFLFSVPVFQPTHYPHGGFEVYDLPNTTFPVRASSRIFMPPPQIFPGTGHPALTPYTPHIIATIGTDPGTLYQLPIPGYYPQDVGYPMDTGVQILHS